MKVNWEEITHEQEIEFINSLLSSPGWEWFTETVLQQVKDAAIHQMVNSGDVSVIHRARGAFAVAEELLGSPEARKALLEMQIAEQTESKQLYDLSPGADKPDEYGLDNS